MKCLKFTLVFNNDTPLHGVHTNTVAFSPSVLIKCSICSCRQSLTRTPHEGLKKTVQDKLVGVTLVGASCLVTWRSGAQSLVIVARLLLLLLLLLWWTAGLGSSAAGTLGGQAKETVKFAGTRLFVESARVQRMRSTCLKLNTKSTN